MAARKQGTVVGVFTNHDDARRATRALKDAGFTDDQIGVASASQNVSEGGDDMGDSYASEGAMAGAATGAGVGALWGLGILAGVLPAIGPAIAGGTLAALLSSAAAGAATAGIVGALIGMGLTKEEAEFYETEMIAGRTIVTVNAGKRRDEAVKLMRQYNGYDMSTHRDDTSTRSAAMRTPATATQGSSYAEHKTIDVPVAKEEVVIERRRGSDQPVSAGSTQGGNEIRIPVKEEQVNVEKQTVIGEEVSVGKRNVLDTERVDEDLRKETIKVETKGKAKVRDKRRK